MTRDVTNFRPDRGAWTSATVIVAATWFFYLIFARLALPELSRELVQGEEWRLRLVAVLLGLGGILGSLGAAWRFNLVRYQRSLARSCRVGGAVAALALVAHSWWIAGVVALTTGLALGWLAVVIASGLRASVGTGGLGTALGLGIGLAYALAQLPQLAAAEPRTQAIIAAFVLLSVSVLVPFVMPQEPSVSPLPAYRGWAVALWSAVFLFATTVAASLPLAPHQALGGGAVERPLTGWVEVAAPVLAGGMAGWWLDRGSAASLRLLVGVAVLVLVSVALLVHADGPARLVGVGGLVGTVALTVGLVYYPARGGRSWHAGIVFAVAGWGGAAVGTLLMNG